jgi:hypothetical protein
LVSSGKLKVVGAEYHLTGGQVQLVREDSGRVRPVTRSQRIALGALVAAVLFGVGLAVGGSLQEVALVWAIPVALLALLVLVPRR